MRLLLSGTVYGGYDLGEVPLCDSLLLAFGMLLPYRSHRARYRSSSS
jgi:hypothetical protein